MQLSTSFRVPALLAVGLSASLVLGCTPGESTSGTGGATGTATGGKVGTGSGGSTPAGSGGSTPAGSGGSTPTGSGGSNPAGSGGNNAGGSGGNNPAGSGGNNPTGSGGSGAGTGGAGGGSTNACSTPDTISNFEEGTGDPVILPGVGVTGKWEVFNDKGAGATQMMKVEATGDTAECKKYALHTTGSGWAMYAGMGITNLAGTAMAPTVYPNTKNYTGIKFRAKVGATHPKNSPVRFNISTPWTEGSTSGGACAGKTTATPEKAGVDCYQHLGR